MHFYGVSEEIFEKNLKKKVEKREKAGYIKHSKYRKKLKRTYRRNRKWQEKL